MSLDISKLKEEYGDALVDLDELNNEFDNIRESDIEEEAEEVPGKIRLFFMSVNKVLEKGLGKQIIIALYILSVIRIIADISMFIRGVINISYTSVPRNFFYYFFALVIPFAAWIWSTKQSYKYFSYTKRKMGGLWIASISMCMVIVNILFLCSCMFIVPLVMLIPVSQDVTGDMILNLARFLILLVPLFVGILSLKGFIDIYTSTGTMELIDRFKIDREWDFRKDKASCYDFAVAKDKKTGKIFRVAEKIRSMHTMVLGATGTGKTSMILKPQINLDINTRVKNENTQKKLVKKMLESGDVTLIDNIEDCDFGRAHFRAKDVEAKKKLDKIFKDNPLCGITVFAPNDDFGNEVYNLAKKRGIVHINRVDPKLENGHYKENFIGYNPFYISDSITDYDRKLEIINKARSFANVLQAIFDASGSSDPYFSNLNRVLTTNLTTIILKAYPMLHVKMPEKYPRKQPTPKIFENIMNDFGLVQDYVDIMKEYLRNHPEERSSYENRVKYIEESLVGAGADETKKQGKGLLNIISDILANPQVENVLCAEDTIDMDVALANNHITLVNYDISMGDTDSKALGLLFLMNFQTAVFRRPKNNRPMHFLYIDEFPVLLHPTMSKIFSLYRQYKVCATVALQNFSQFNEQPSTRFMLDVVRSNARTHMIFGDLGVEEMEYYQKLMGTDFSVSSQHTVSESALSLEETSLSYSTRSSVIKDDVVTGNELRRKDSGEGTILTSQKNNAKEMFSVVLDYLDEEKDAKTMSVVEVTDWSVYYNDESAAGTRKVKTSEDNNVIVNASKPKLPIKSNLKVTGADVANDAVDEKAFFSVGFSSMATVSSEYKDKVKKMREDLRESVVREADKGITASTTVSIPQNNSSENAVMDSISNLSNSGSTIDSILGKMSKKVEKAPDKEVKQESAEENKSVENTPATDNAPGNDYSGTIDSIMANIRKKVD